MQSLLPRPKLSDPKRTPWLAMAVDHSINEERARALKARGVSLAELRLDLPGRSIISAHTINDALDALTAAQLPTMLTLNRGGDNQIKLITPSMLKRVIAVDLELKACERDSEDCRQFIKRTQTCGVELVISFHDFERAHSLPELQAQVDQALSIGGDVVKIAVIVNNESDCQVLHELLIGNLKKSPMIVIGMGDAGRKTRWMLPRFGSLVTFARAESGGEAPGQIKIEELAAKLAEPGLKKASLPVSSKK